MMRKMELSVDGLFPRSHYWRGMDPYPQQIWTCVCLPESEDKKRALELEANLGTWQVSQEQTHFRYEQGAYLTPMFF